jgi:hypothetical protein
MNKDVKKAQIEFYKSDRYFDYVSRQKCYSKIPTLNEMVNTFTSQTVNKNM